MLWVHNLASRILPRRLWIEVKDVIVRVPVKHPATKALELPRDHLVSER